MEHINIVEPTLMSETGHCYSFLNSLCQASNNVRLYLWVNRYANITFDNINVTIEKHFYRKIRRIQSYFLYRKLLKAEEKLFVSTATISDLVLLNWAAGGCIPKHKTYLYFHWLNINEKKLKLLTRLAKQQPNIVILGPTYTVIQSFQNAGFANVQLVPYPISTSNLTIKPEQNSFKGLLYAGAARQDKGISHVVDLIELMSSMALKIPFKLQNSPDHHGKYDTETKADLKRLQTINYSHLELFPDTLSAEEYASLFTGVICIQLYNPTLFADRISGVTLDALSAGSPIITIAGSWIALMVERFDAGITIDRADPEATLSAIHKIIENYAYYNKNAYAAGLALRQENSPEFLFNTLTNNS